MLVEEKLKGNQGAKMTTDAETEDPLDCLNTYCSILVLLYYCPSPAGCPHRYTFTALYAQDKTMLQDDIYNSQ